MGENRYYWIMFGNTSIDHTIRANRYETAIAAAKGLQAAYQVVVIKNDFLETVYTRQQAPIYEGSPIFFPRPNPTKT